MSRCVYTFNKPTFYEEDIRVEFNCKNINKTKFNCKNINRTKIFTTKSHKKIFHYEKHTKNKTHKIKTILHSAVLMIMNAGELQNVWNFSSAKKEKAAYLTKFGTEHGINCVPTQLEKLQQNTVLPWSSLKNYVNSKEIIFSKSLAVDTGPKISHTLPITKSLPRIDTANITTIQEEIDFINYFRTYFHSFSEVKESLLHQDFFSFFQNISRHATLRAQFFTLINNNRFANISSYHALERIKFQTILCNLEYKKVILPCLRSDFQTQPIFKGNIIDPTHIHLLIYKPYNLVYIPAKTLPPLVPNSPLADIPHILSIPSSPSLTSLGFTSLDFFTLLPF